MSPEEVLRLAKKIEDTLGPAVIVSVKEKNWLVNALRGLTRLMKDNKG